MRTRVRGALVLAEALTVGWLTPVLFVGATGFGASMVPAALIALAVAVVLAWRLRRTLRWIVDAFVGRHPVWLALMFAAALVATVSTLRLAVFMADPARVEYAYVPSDPFRVGHSCLSAYTEGARFAVARDRNIYEPGAYRPRTIGLLRVDPYHYPPPFLLLPAGLALLVPDFASQRAVWFMLQVLILAGAGLMVARWIGGPLGAWTAGASWLLLASPPVFMTLQQGNFQLTVMPLAMIACVLIYRGRVVSGASVLAFATVAKIIPGVLILWLLASRRWRALAIVAVASVLLFGATLAAFGWQPIADFVRYEIPRIASGEAFPRTEAPETVALNLSVYGLTVRLRALGLTWLDAPTGRTITSIYGILVLLLAAAAGWRATRTPHLAAPVTPPGRLAVAQLLLALLSLASFRSPFVGLTYGFVASIWLLTLLAAGASTTLRRLACVAGIALLSVEVLYTLSPTAGTPSAWVVAFSAVVFTVALSLNLGVVVHALRRRAVDTEPDALPLHSHASTSAAASPAS